MNAAAIARLRALAANPSVTYSDAELQPELSDLVAAGWVEQINGSRWHLTAAGVIARRVLVGMDRRKLDYGKILGYGDVTPEDDS